jgi:hypothetical protein
MDAPTKGCFKSCSTRAEIITLRRACSGAWVFPHLRSVTRRVNGGRRETAVAWKIHTSA